MDKSSERPANDPNLAVSAKIRNRLRLAKQRFHANDNISSFIEPGELDRLLEEVTAKMKGVLESLVIDIESDHNTHDSARRVAKMYWRKCFEGGICRLRLLPNSRILRT